ncbi:hypothetical protein V2J09_001629 [Rumex salicifolius]
MASPAEVTYTTNFAGPSGGQPTLRTRGSATVQQGKEQEKSDQQSEDDDDDEWEDEDERKSNVPGAHAHVVKVYVSIFDDERGRDVALSGLKAKAKYVRGQLGKRMKLRLTPEVRFIEDESFERGSRVIAILDKIKNEKEPKDIQQGKEQEESDQQSEDDDDDDDEWEDEDGDEDIIHVDYLAVLDLQICRDSYLRVMLSFPSHLPLKTKQSNNKNKEEIRETTNVLL